MAPTETGDARVSLLVNDDPPTPPTALHDTLAWRALHCFSFLLGGVTFIGGTVALYYTSPAAGLASAILYTVGSLGFLAVDVQEFLTFRSSSCNLRANIGASACGSSAYVLGSVFFIPSLLSSCPNVGAVGFEVGSGVIAISQSAKVARLLFERSALSAIMVEAGACVGAIFFLVGTLLLPTAPLPTVLALWLAGSGGFTIGGLALGFRHFLLGVT
jgi:hypothetical protein